MVNGVHGNLLGKKRGTRILIVGGVAGGASAAARARRLSEDAEIVMFERGEFISFANCGLPYYVGGVIPEFSDLLVQTPEGMKKRFRIDVRTQTEVLRIDKARKTILLRDLTSGREFKEPYDFLILSPGAEPFRPQLAGTDSKRIFTVRNLQDAATIKKILDEGKIGEALIVGGGYVGLEMAEALAAKKVKVTLIEQAHQVMGPVDPEMAVSLHEELLRQGVRLKLGTSVRGFKEENGLLQAEFSTGELMTCGLVIFAIGVKPETRLAREAHLQIGAWGGISVDEHMRTSDPSIYAVGDAVEIIDFVGGFHALVPLAGPANRQGRIAADHIFGKKSVYKGTQGTAVCKVFDYVIGMTGLNEKALKRASAPYEKIYVHPNQHAGYYPGAHSMTIKLLFTPRGGKLLGAQIVGRDGVDKRIDVLATAIRSGLTVYDLEELELAYAPPYGSAKDAINYAGFVAANFLRHDVAICHSEDISKPRANQLPLDVRTLAEFQRGTVPGALHIPVDELRERLAELPRGKELLVFCQAGLRGYLACRILSQNGFRCRNLSGGYKTYSAAVASLKVTP